MTWYTAVFLGLVQGLAEFLPISSSGHLLLFENLFGITDGGLLLTLILHLATLLAVVVVYRHRLWQMVRHPWNKETLRLGLATVITCVIVVLFHDVIDRLFTVAALPYAFLCAGIYLLVPAVMNCYRRHQIVTKTVGAARPWWQAAAMGLAQGVAVVPGLSRSGLTITTGRLSGMSGAESTDFSFLMSIPIILASLVYELCRGGSVGNLGIGSILLAFVTAFLAGIVAIKIMLEITRKIDLRWFALYLLLLGAGLLIGSWF
ncbi:MAG: undecaprenyl-diphosphate phosphatase [Clostridia bacterium]|nr:undecaprenyl-diphosphate phosphatase [Clostridia bacterium]